MKYLKILYWITLILAIVLAVNAIADTIFFLNMRSTFESAYKDTYFGFYTAFTGEFIRVFLIIGLFYMQRALHLILKTQSFNSRSTNLMKIAGLFILFYGLGYIIFQVNFIHSAEPFSIFENILSSIAVMLVGFGIYSFSEILKKGDLIQKEQDLTI